MKKKRFVNFTSLHHLVCLYG